jgi:hypothetical protein
MEHIFQSFAHYPQEVTFGSFVESFMVVGHIEMT